MALKKTNTGYAPKLFGTSARRLGDARQNTSFLAYAELSDYSYDCLGEITHCLSRPATRSAFRHPVPEQCRIGRPRGSLFAMLGNRTGIRGPDSVPTQGPQSKTHHVAYGTRCVRPDQPPSDHSTGVLYAVSSAHRNSGSRYRANRKGRPKATLSAMPAGDRLYILERARRFERPTLTLARLCSTPELRPPPIYFQLERARRFERPTLTLARLCSTPELRPQSVGCQACRTKPARLQGEKCKFPEFSRFNSLKNLIRWKSTASTCLSSNVFLVQIVGLMYQGIRRWCEDAGALRSPWHQRRDLSLHCTHLSGLVKSV